MPITGLSITNVGPFEEIEFEFDPQVNVFTGPNNSGKSSVLCVLGDIAVYPFSFPQKLLRSENKSKFKVHIQAGSDIDFQGELPCYIVDTDRNGPTGIYWNKERSDQHITVMKTIGYSKFIPALRRGTDFRSPGPMVQPSEEWEGGFLPYPVETELVGRRGATQRRLARIRRRADDQQDPDLKKRLALTSESPSMVSDEAVIQKIVELDYRSYLRKQSALHDVIIRIGEIASDITDGFPIKFIGVKEDTDGFFPEFETIDGVVPLNTMSQGTQSIIQWLGHLLIGYAEYYDFPESLEDNPGILIIDEIDAHLHPSWQQRIIPTLTRHFPHLQIFCSSHSPMMLAGLKEGQAHLLKRDEHGKVTVSRNEVDIKGWTADEILRNFLGLVDPTDLETVSNLERLQNLRSRESLSDEEKEELERLRHMVSDNLLSGPISAQMEQFARAMRGADR